MSASMLSTRGRDSSSPASSWHTPDSASVTWPENTGREVTSGSVTCLRLRARTSAVSGTM